MDDLHVRGSQCDFGSPEELFRLALRSRGSVARTADCAGSGRPQPADQRSEKHAVRTAALLRNLTDGLRAQIRPIRSFELRTYRLISNDRYGAAHGKSRPTYVARNAARAAAVGQSHVVRTAASTKCWLKRCRSVSFCTFPVPVSGRSVTNATSSGMHHFATLPA